VTLNHTLEFESDVQTTGLSEKKKSAADFATLARLQGNAKV
jgi:hypothetical protein